MRVRHVQKVSFEFCLRSASPGALEGVGMQADLRRHDHFQKLHIRAGFTLGGEGGERPVSGDDDLDVAAPPLWQEGLFCKHFGHHEIPGCTRGKQVPLSGQDHDRID